MPKYHTDEDLRQRAAAAKLAVTARNNPGYQASLRQQVLVDYPHPTVAGKFLRSAQASLAHPADGDRKEIATDCLSPHVKPRPASFVHSRVVVR